MVAWNLIALGLVIGSNNFAAALALGALDQKGRRVRTTAVFGAFEFTIPLLGLWAGERVSEALADHVGWLAPTLLELLRLWSLWAAIRHESAEQRMDERMTTWRGLVLLAFGLSIDNLVVGFSLGLMGSEPLLVASVIAACSMAFTWIGLTFGGEARRHWERPAELGAGGLLLGLATAIALGWL